MSKVDDAWSRRLALAAIFTLARRALTTAELASQLETSQDTVRADIRALERVNYQFERIVHDATDRRIRMIAGHKIAPPSDWGKAEFAALAGSREPCMVGSARQNIVEELLGLTPAPEDETQRRRVRVCEEAKERQELVELPYTNNTKNIFRVRTVEPYELRTAGGHMFLIGYDPDAEDAEKGRGWRIYMDERMAPAPSATHRSFEPRDYDPTRFKESSGLIWQVQDRHAILRVGKAHARSAQRDRRLRPDQKVTPQKDGSVLIETHDAGLHELSFWLMGFFPNAEVVGPNDLRVQMGLLLHEMAARHFGEPVID